MPFSRWTWVSRCLLKQRMMEAVVTTGLLELLVVQSSSQIITTNKPTSSFLQAISPSCRPTNSVKALKGKISFHGLAHTKLTWGLPTVSHPPSIWPHLCCGAGHEKRRGEQLKWSLAFRLYIGSFPCAQLPGPVHTARLGRVCFLFSLGL